MLLTIERGMKGGSRTWCSPCGLPS
jgi:hypothetical protein